MRKWNWRTVLAGLACGAAALGGVSIGSSQAEAGSISIGMTVWVGYGPLFLARDLGYFKDAGVDVDLNLVDDSTLALAAEASGKMTGMAGTIDEILKYRSKSFCFKTVTVLDESHGGDGMVVADNINSLNDVKGKTVALNEGSTSQFWFSYLLKTHGIPLKDAPTTNMTADDAAAAFIAGRVPVAVTWEPNLTMVKTKHAGKVLIDSSTTPGVIVDVLELSCDVIKNQPNDVKALLTGLNRAVDYLNAHQDQAYPIMAKAVGGYLKNPKDFADAAKGVRFYDKAMVKTYMGTTAKPGQIGNIIKLGNSVWKDLGKMKHTVTYNEVVDPSFAQAQ
jgi:NitT/TauT family transport system substrate-binding protein